MQKLDGDDLQETVKNYAEGVIKVFCSSPILTDFFTLFQVFCPEL